MPESREPTLPRRVIFSAVQVSDRSSRELLMAERRSTTPLDAVAEELRGKIVWFHLALVNKLDISQEGKLISQKCHLNLLP